MTLPSFDPLEAPSLARLVGRGELAELCGRAQPLVEGIAIFDDQGYELASAGPPIGDGAEVVRVPIRVQVDEVGSVVAVGPLANQAASLTSSAVEIAAHYALAVRLSSATHEVVVTQTYEQLSARRDELEAAMNRVRDVDRLKRNFLSTMSHELRTPLTSVIGYTEMLLEGLAGPLHPAQRDYMRIILNKADQLLQMISSVLEVANLDAGVTPVSESTVELRSIVDEVITGNTDAQLRRGVTVSARGGGEIAGDRDKLRCAISHLVSNAVKFTRDGGAVEVEILPGPRTQGGSDQDAMHVIVRDAGVGIASEILDRIFEPFFQADSSSTREYGGAGVGLTLARAYVEAHGGTIWVESEVGRGTTFVAALPRRGAPKP